MSEAQLRAELLEDRGEAAAGGEFFRSRELLDAEAVTHTLLIAGEDVELFAPLTVRTIGEGPERDATSPYGYPGLVPTSGEARVDHTQGGTTLASPIDPSAVDFSATGLVSVFIRHTLGEPPLLGASARNLVQIADPDLPPKSRGSDRNQINKNLRRGYEVRIVPGPATTAADRSGFLDAYEQTMRRTAAADRYFFGAAYFDRILESDHTWLALANDPTGEIAAASIAAVSDGFLHYYLSGTGDSYLPDSPMKNVVASLIEHAAVLGLPLNLGGGISRGDHLEEFKRGFANRELSWRTSEIVCDRDAYARLAGDRDSAGFFPAYRAAAS